MPANPLPANVLDALRRGNTIEAIKLLRESSGLGLKEAKDIIDAHLHGNPAPVVAAAPASPLPSAVVAALQRGDKIEAIKLLREQSGLGLKEAKDVIEASQRKADALVGMGSPGAVQASGNVVWLVLAVAFAALAGYYFLISPG